MDADARAIERLRAERDAAAQRATDRIVHYRNLSVVLGAKPTDMFDEHDRKLCADGVGDRTEALADSPDAWACAERAECLLGESQAREARLREALKVCYPNANHPRAEDWAERRRAALAESSPRAALALPASDALREHDATKDARIDDLRAERDAALAQAVAAQARESRLVEMLVADPPKCCDADQQAWRRERDAVLTSPASVLLAQHDARLRVAALREAVTALALAERALAAREATIARLRDALHAVAAELETTGTPAIPKRAERFVGALLGAREALALPADSSALDALLADARREVARGIVEALHAPWIGGMWAAVEAAADRLAPGWRGEGTR